MNTIASVQQECSSSMDKLKPAEEVQDSVNKRCDELFWWDENGDDRPFVRTLCDEVTTSGSAGSRGSEKEQRIIYVE
jgi:hypothetical protein